MARRDTPAATVHTTVAPSSLIKGRHQLTVVTRLLVRAPVSCVFDTALKDPTRFWRWHIDRDDPTMQLDVSPGWPAAGSWYRYRKHSKLGLCFEKWEPGRVEMLSDDPPNHTVTREHQGLITGLGKILVPIDSRFTAEAGATRVTIQHDIMNRSRVLEMLLSPGAGSEEHYRETMSEPLHAQAVRLAQACESAGLDPR